MPSSFFNYPITRPYPYSWFTPVAVVGGICLLSLLSVLNFVQNSYNLTVEYATDPNTTIASDIWFQHWPSYITRTVRPACEPANLPLNTQFFTNQSGLTWTLTSVTNDDDVAPISPSLTYMNNVLENCRVNQIQMDFDGTQDREVAVVEVTPWDVQVRVFATCGTSTLTGYNLLNLTAMYDPVQSFPVAGSSLFVATDPKHRASMYWAQALLSTYWVATATRIWQASLTVSPAPTKGVAMLYPVAGKTDITASSSFFDVEFDFLEKDNSAGFGWHGPRQPIDVYINHTIFDLNPTPQIWATVDLLAKSMYSAALADLGQISSAAQSSLVTDAATIQSYSSEFARINEVSGLGYNSTVMQSYEQQQESTSPTGALGLTPSVIEMKYLCQVPRRRPIGDIFISVLLADLVLLQAAWKLYTFLVNWALMRRKGCVKFCEGCIESQVEDVGDGGKLVDSNSNSFKSGTVVSIRSRTTSEDARETSRKVGPSWRFAWLR